MKHPIMIWLVLLFLLGCGLLSNTPDERDLTGQLEFRRAAFAAQPGWIEASVLGGGSMYLAPTADLTSDEIASARIHTAPTGITFAVQFTDTGATRMADLTSQNIGQPLAVLLDGEVIIAPIIQTPISDEATFQIQRDDVTPRLMDMLELRPQEIELLERG